MEDPNEPYYQAMEIVDRDPAVQQTDPPWLGIAGWVYLVLIIIVLVVFLVVRAHYHRKAPRKQ